MKNIIFCPEGGLGKIIASTAVAKGLRKKYPDDRLIVMTPWVDPYIHLDFIDRVYRTGLTTYFYHDYIKDKEFEIFKQEPYFNSKHINKKQHVIKSWFECFNLEYNNEVPTLKFSQVELQEVNKYKKDKPIFVIQTTGGPFTESQPYAWTRDMPISVIESVVAKYRDQYNFIQIARPGSYPIQDAMMLGEISKRELMALLTISDKSLLIDSCLQHAAAALNIKSTVLWVGTSPKVFGYSIHDNFIPQADYKLESNIEASLFDYDFNGRPHECPFETMDDLYDISEVIQSIETQKKAG